MEFVIAILLFPFALAGWMYGWLICKGLYNQLYVPKKAGIEQVVRKWEGLTSEERMEATRRGDTSALDKTAWLGSPTPKEEEQALNERVFREGLIHTLPETKVEDARGGE